MTRLGDLLDFGQLSIDIWRFFSGHTGSTDGGKSIPITDSNESLKV